MSFEKEVRLSDAQLSLQHKSPTKKAASSSASYDELKEKRAWDVATAPVKSLPMQAFMLYMSGGGVQIFSIGIVFMLLLTPFKNIAGMNEGEQSITLTLISLDQQTSPSFRAIRALI